MIPRRVGAINQALSSYSIPIGRQEPYIKEEHSAWPAVRQCGDLS